MGAKILRFSVRGQGGHIHVVRAVIGARTVTLTCSCDGDRRSHMCHHRESLLDGNTSHVISKNKDDVLILMEAAERTDFGRWFSIRRAYDGDMSSIRDRLAQASRRYALEADLPAPPPPAPAGDQHPPTPAQDQPRPLDCRDKAAPPAVGAPPGTVPSEAVSCETSTPDTIAPDTVVARRAQTSIEKAVTQPPEWA